jgi:hypothetical protein
VKKHTLYLLTAAIILFGFAKLSPSNSISKATALIKKYITSPGIDEVDVRIINQHNGRYTIVSSVRSTLDSIRLYSYMVDMTGGKRDTVIYFSKKIFLSKLDKASLTSNSFKLAGHHQTITVKKGDREDVFQTTDGRALMDLLEYGE